MSLFDKPSEVNLRNSEDMFSSSKALLKSVYITSTWSSPASAVDKYWLKVSRSVAVDLSGKKPCCSSMTTDLNNPKTLL